METSALQMHDLFFGDLTDMPNRKSAQAENTGLCEPFQADELDHMLDLFPQALLDDMENTFLCYQRSRKTADLVEEDGEYLDPERYFQEHGEYPNESIRKPASECLDLFSEDILVHTKMQDRVYKDFIWLYGLNKKQYGLPFEQVCLVLAIDPEIIRDTISHQFSEEIREFVLKYSYAKPDDVKRIKGLFRPYINFGN